MTTKTYVDYTTPAVDAAWLNDVDRLLYDILGNPADDAAVLTGLGVTATAAELNILDGVTATAAELNVLDGITPTVTELNYVDGVTSAIQTQLDAKAALAGSASQAFAASTFTGNLTGNVTGNVTGNTSGSSGSCTGNAATANAVTVSLDAGVVGTTQAVGTSNTTIATTAFCDAGFVNNDAGTNGVGRFATAVTVSGVVASGDTTSGSNLNESVTGSPNLTSGTWRNVSTSNCGTATTASFQRIS